MDANTKKGIEEILKLSERDGERFYGVLEERTNHSTADTIKAMVMIAGWFKKSNELKSKGII